MADNDQLLQQIRKVVREEVEAKKARNENSLQFFQLGNKIDRVENRLKDVEISNGRLEQGQAQHTTMLEAVAAGQKELQEIVAKEADLLDLQSDLGKKVKDHEERIANLEEHTGTHNPHKN